LYRIDQMTALHVAILVFRNQMGPGGEGFADRGVRRRLLNQLDNRMSNWGTNFLQKVRPAVAAMTGFGGG
jgi:hypothetical protein